MNLAIVIGVDTYQSSLFDNLPACKNDAMAISNVLSNVKHMEDILFISNESGIEAKRKISDFVENYKGQDIDELTFYFSGHGERVGDDFFYIFTDFDRAKKETTGLRNSDLDNLVKTLSPKLFVKIVDACFSGTQYIKSESPTTEEYLRKSISKHGFNNLYFLHSSAGTEPSWAGSEFSRFTESILTSLTDYSGDVRYSEIMSSVADDLSRKGASKPTFITQADHIEKFGLVTEKTHALIYKLFGIDGDNKAEDVADNSTPRAELSVFDIIGKKSAETCFGEQKILDFISNFNSEINNWGELEKVYTIETQVNINPRMVPGSSKIGLWLSEDDGRIYFASPTYNEEQYTVEEYKLIPKKPGRGRSAAVAIAGLWGMDDNEYKLENVTKSRRYISGLDYTHSAENQISETRFTPKIELIDQISLYTVIIYSNMNLVVHFSYEFLTRKNWINYSTPVCKEWRILKVNANGATPAKTTAQHIIKEVIQWFEENIKLKVES